MSRRTIFILVLVIVNVALDQFSKFWVRANVDPSSITEIIGQQFILTNVENTGAFLGMGSDLSPTLKWIFLLILPVIVLGYVVYHVFKEKQLDRLSLIGFCCIIGGGFANVFDRFAYGSVTDFWRIDLGGFFRTGIFNIADVSVTSGMIMLIVATIIYRKKAQKNPE